MIKKKVFEDELIFGMMEKLASNNAKPQLTQAVDYLNSAYDIFEDAGMKSQADKILTILSKIAAQDPRKISDPHTKGLTSDKMVKNLLHHGTEFNMADSDVLNLEIDESSDFPEDSEMDFEDEI